MNSFLKNYSSTLLLLFGILCGSLVGIFAPAIVPYLLPIGEIYINFLFTLVVPLVACSVTLAFYNLFNKKLVLRVFSRAFAMYLLMFLVVCALTYVATLLFNPFENIHAEKNSFVGTEEMPFGPLLVNTVSVSDFLLLLDKSHLLALVIFSVFLGYTFYALGDRSTRAIAFFEKCNDTVMKMIDFIIRFAPLCMGCYFAQIIASLGKQLLSGYMWVFVLTAVLFVILFFLVNPAYIFLAMGKTGVQTYFRNIFPVSLTAMATCSSSICMPLAIDSCKKMGVSETIAEALIPLGTNIHKDGSLISCVFKTLLAVSLLGMSIYSLPIALLVVVFSIITSIVVGTVPGGAMTSEILLCSLLGCTDPQLASILVVIAIIIDIFCTPLNVAGNITATFVIDHTLRKK